MNSWRPFLVSLAWLLAGMEVEAAVTFEAVTSAALGRPMPVAVVTPARPIPPEGFPVLFLLHGRGRTHRSLIDAPAARQALEAAPFCTVLPRGDDGWYIDSPVQPAARYESYLAEVVAWATRTLPVSGRATQRGIAGWSMGGYGAVRHATRHPGDFAFVASIIGLLDFPRPDTLPPGQNYPVPVARFTADPAVWATFNPLVQASALAGRTVTRVLATRGFERAMNENFITALSAAGGHPRVHRLDGGHEFDLVERAIPLVLADAADCFATPRHP
jgi:S-formylglutathione hydrolase FrmB